MKRQILSIIMGVFIILFAFSSSSLAQIQEKSFSLSPQIGGYLFQNHQNLKTAFTLGAGAGYYFTKKLETEFVFNVVNTEFDTTGGDMNVHLYRLDGLYHFRPDTRLVPYLAAGLGGISFDPDNGKGEDKFLVNYGGGLKYFLKEKIALRGDIRHIISFDKVYSNLIYTAGVEFIFGGVKKVSLPMPESDSDGDGVVDSKDNCTKTPKGTMVDASGCPMDSDADGVYDSLDKCPDTPIGVPVAPNGCPLDSDADGIADNRDNCPNTPEDLKVDTAGCPVVLKEKVTIDLDIQFDTDQTEIKPQYFEHLKKVADFMSTYPDTKAVIEGYSDNVGPTAYNQKLSQRRADNVRKYLIETFNINPDRITAIGFGEERPIASNDTEEGRLQNRRIQAVLNAEKEIYQKR